MKPVERIMLTLHILQSFGSTEEENSLFYRLLRVYNKRYFKSNTIPYTLCGEYTDHILGF